jgi:uncharacterized protein (DUF1501 family)
MKRRSFLQATSLTSAAFMLKGIPVIASNDLSNETLKLLGEAAYECDKILVIIQMNGGNDGLNTVFPLDYWSNLSTARSNILLDETEVLKLNLNDTTGLHPAMVEMQEMYNNGKLLIVQGVSYPNPSYSHFRATDIWFTASDSDETLTSGWLGRALEHNYPNYPTGYPSTSMPDPLAIQIGSTLPFSLQSSTINMGYSVPNPNSLLNVVNETTDPAPNDDYGYELTFLRLMKDQSNVYSDSIKAAYSTPQGQEATYPTDNKLGDQLKIVAKLINGGLKTPIYIVNHPRGFDSHEQQVDDMDKTQGVHANNLMILSQAISAFQQDLELMKKDDKVTGMTFSEFGRRIISNASKGTDHGAGAPVFFFGSNLNTNPSEVTETQFSVPGMIGVSPVIPQNAGVSDQVQMQFDFRQLYTTIMQDWLCMSEESSKQVLGNDFSTLPIFKKKITYAANLDDAKNAFVLVYPNPSYDRLITIELKDQANTQVQIDVFNVNGNLVYTKIHTLSGGKCGIDLSSTKAKGLCIMRVSYNSHIFHKKLQLM